MAEESSGGNKSANVEDSTPENLENQNLAASSCVSPENSNSNEQNSTPSLEDAEKGKVKLAVEDNKSEDHSDDDEEELPFPGFSRRSLFLTSPVSVHYAGIGGNGETPFKLVISNFLCNHLNII
ncbi:hypothetical protein LOTGIDRAFT_166515 [Lottia gigantea]|uniref:Uncharacterized protein n=1 Tax=Lottia gigantea TaxID=225164 RepID=V4A278_LOTGI|nr:hypothetical protein LOTGIDRAFT_166515 [Lottia gigantea]ESO87371.1 hypothetical protein LOTGIDRAFT_166515 [Lottia gigantea]